MFRLTSLGRASLAALTFTLVGAPAVQAGGSAFAEEALSCKSTAPNA